MYGSMINHKGGRYFWWSLIISVVSITLYAYHDPFDGANGGTWLGYSLGVVATLIILWLTYFGIRKRHYTSSLGTVTGWLSAHIYIGLSLIFVATLHTGFQFGWNLHTYTYIIMLVVILSGAYGVFSYLYYPSLLTLDREDSTQQTQFTLLDSLNKRSLDMADSLGEKVHDIVLQSVEKSKIPYGITRQLFLDPSLGGWASNTNLYLSEMIAKSDDGEKNKLLREMIDVLSEKCELISQLQRDIKAKARMEVWLYIHIPLTFCLLGCLIAHILSVFFFW